MPKQVQIKATEEQHERWVRAVRTLTKRTGLDMGTRGLSQWARGLMDRAADEVLGEDPPDPERNAA